MRIGRGIDQVIGIVTVVIVDRLFYLTLQSELVPLTAVGFQGYRNLVALVDVKFVVIEFLGQDMDQLATVMVQIDMFDDLGIIVGK